MNVALPSRSPRFGDALDALICSSAEGSGRLRAWSLVVTVFGDAVAPRGGVLRLAALQEVTGRLGVEAGALRTAMSRLARDGWLARDRRGRASYYALTEAKRAELDAATRRIYAAGPPDWDGGWRIALLPPSAGCREGPARALRAAGFARASEGVHLRPDAPGAGPPPEISGLSLFRAPVGAACVAPELIAAVWPPEAAAARFADLASRIAPLAAAGAPDAPLDAMAARSLLIHLWRRAVLASADLPEALHPPDWPGEAARAATRALYWRLAGPSEAWLDACRGGPDGALPPAAPDFAGRFGGPLG